MKKGTRIDEDKLDQLIEETHLSLAAIERICCLPKNWRQNIKRNGTAPEDVIGKLSMFLRISPDELRQQEKPNWQQDDSGRQQFDALQDAEKRLNEKADLLHGENLEVKQKLESMPEMIAAALARYLSAEAWLFSKLKHNRDGISETQIKQLAQNNGIAPQELEMAMETIGADRYKKNGNTWLSLYREI